MVTNEISTIAGEFEHRLIPIQPVFHLIRQTNIFYLSWIVNNVKFGNTDCDLEILCFNADKKNIDSYVITLPANIVGNWAENGDLVIDDFVLSSNSNYKLQTETK